MTFTYAPKDNYIEVMVKATFPEYRPITCKCRAHLIAWFLTYGEWVPSGMELDHIDGDRRNNKLSNLRLATFSQNTRNRSKRVGNYTSQYKGVRRRPYNRWEAEIHYQNVRKRLGSFTTEVEAAQAYDIAAKELHGEFANLNFPTPAPQENPIEQV